MGSPTRWPLPIALDEGADRYRIAEHIFESGSVTWHGDHLSQARLTVSGTERDMSDLRDEVGAGTVVRRGYQSRFEMTGNRLVGFVVRGTWHFLAQPEGRHVRDALAPLVWEDAAYCAFPQCPSTVAAKQRGFCTFHDAVWCRVHEADAASSFAETCCPCGRPGLLPVGDSPVGHRRSLCDACFTEMRLLHSQLRTALDGTPTSEWVDRVSTWGRDIPLPGLLDVPIGKWRPSAPAWDLDA